MSDDALVIEGAFSASIGEVWQAITSKDEMKQWYFDLTEFRPEVGFEFEFEGGDETKTFLHACKVTEVVPGKKLTYSWRYPYFEGISFVTFELSEEDESTRLKLTHAGLESFPAIKDFARENFVAGWRHIIGTSLKNFVEKG